MELKAKKNHKSDLRHHQERVEWFWGKYQKVREEIEEAYEDLATLGWTQMSDHESDIPEGTYMPSKKQRGGMPEAERQPREYAIVVEDLDKDMGGKTTSDEQAQQDNT
eukprot:15021577-Heterocapsa_arctica.AAC.1